MEEDFNTPLQQTVAGAAVLPEDANSGVRREVGDLPEDRAAMVKRINKDVLRARKFWEKDFKRMRKNMDMLIGIQNNNQTDIDDDNSYVANIIQRHVQQRTAAVYAKNPTVVARRKETMDFEMWDENPLTFQMAQQAVTMGNQLQAGLNSGDPNAMQAATRVTPVAMQEFTIAQALLQDIQKGLARRAAAKRVARTMQIYFKNKVLAQQHPPFKASMKQTVRRTLATGVGYVKLGVVRAMEMSPDVVKGMATLQEQMATIDNLMADSIDKNIDLAKAEADKEELRLALQGLRDRPMVISQEGLTFDFPSSTSIIPDWRLTQLKGFVGCEFVAEEYMFTPDVIQKIWRVDVRGEGGKLSCTGYDPSDNPTAQVGKDGDKDALCCVWIVYDRTTGLTYTICDGYKDFLEEPCPPKIHLERFWPWFVLSFNDLEHHKQKFPISDVHLLRFAQMEYNRSREALREHRIANRPLTAIPASAMSAEDKQKLQDRPANAVVEITCLQPGQDVNKLIQTVQHPQIDPAVYDVTPVFQDVLRVVGSQEANLGGTSNSTATESSIAESSRMSSLQSNMDDMDDFLSEIMRAAGQVALLEIDPAEVKRVVGPGASWPVLSAQEVADEIFLEIQAGSSGRPNKSVEVQNMTQTAPIVLQIPGINPEWFGRELLTRMDDRLDLTDAFLAGQPSIQTLNALMAKPLGQGPAGPGAEDPNAQGGRGGQNVEAPGQGGGALGPQAGNAGAPAPAASAPVPLSA